MALVIAKHVELKTGISIRKFVDEAKKNADGEIFNSITNKIVTIKAKPTFKMNEYLEKLFSPH